MAKWIQKAVKKMEQKGTKGSFTRWCKSNGYDGVTSDCISAALKKGGKVAKKASFAKAMRSIKK